MWKNQAGYSTSIHLFSELGLLKDLPQWKRVPLKDKMLLLLEDAKEHGAIQFYIGTSRTLCRAHSCVIRAFLNVPLLHPHMTEGEQHTVEIVDTEPTVFMLLLKFLYTSRLDSEELAAHAKALLVLSDKYQIVELKQICEVFLIHSVHFPSEELDLCGLLIFADLHQATLLKEACKRVLIHRGAPMLEDPSYDEMGAPLLKELLLESLSSKRRRV